MRDRWHLKGSKNKYDPQIGEAAKANAAVAQQAQDWNKDYFDKYVAPAMAQITKESDINIQRQGEIHDLEMSQAKLADDRYRTLGIPAEDRYYKMVADYSAPEEQERQAGAALGDIRTAQAGQQSQLSRQMRGLGIDPSSPAAMAAQSDFAFKNAAAEAGGATRARTAAQALGMSLTSDAANFGRGGQSGILQFGSAASGAAGAGASGAAQAGQVTPGGAANVNTGLGLAQKAYGSNLDAYTTLGNTAMQQPTALGQIGQLAGQLGSSALSAYGPHSDRRLKTRAKKLATLAHDIGLWEFNYIWEPITLPAHVGYMADEVEPVFPDAVHTDPNGYKRVNYDKVLV